MGVVVSTAIAKGGKTDGPRKRWRQSEINLLAVAAGDYTVDCAGRLSIDECRLTIACSQVADELLETNGGIREQISLARWIRSYRGFEWSDDRCVSPM